MRLECMAVRYTEDPSVPFYMPEVCFPRDPTRPNLKYPCQPLYWPGDSFFDSIKSNFITCKNPGDSSPYCYYRFTKDVKVTFYPNREDLIRSFLRNYVEFINGDPIDSAYLFNLLDNPEFLDHMAFVLGISSTSLWGDYGYVVVRIDKLGVFRSVDVDLSQSVLNQQRKTDFINELTAAVSDDDIAQLMSKYGTHYLAGWDLSDFMLQTFVFSKTKYSSLKTKWQLDSENTDGANFIKYVGTTYSQTYVTPIEKGVLKTFAEDPLARGDTYSYRCIDKLIDSANGFDRDHRSIFKFIEQQKLMEYSCDESFTRRAPIKLRFGSLTTLLLGSQHQTLKEKWDKVLERILTHRFGMLVNTNTPNFVNTPNQASSLPFYGSFNPIVVTHTASAYISILQMHYNLNDLDTDISNPEFVKHIVIMADVIEVGESSVRVPGSMTVYIICRHLISHSTSTTLTTLYVDTDDVNISAEEITGVLQVIDMSTNTSYTYYDEQLVYKTVDDTDVHTVGAHTIQTIQGLVLATSTEMPRLYVNDPSVKLSEFLHRSFYEGHELALTTAEVILSLGVRVTTNSESMPRAVKVLNWISNTLSQIEATKLGQPSALSFEQEEILSRVLLIQTTRVPFYLSGHVLVPMLTYEFYKPYYETVLNLVDDYEVQLQTVKSTIETRLASETIVQNQQQLNVNIKDIGKFLVQQATANKKKEEDITKAFDQLITINNNGIADKQTYADELINEIDELQNDAKKKGDSLIACVKKQTIISLIFSVVDVAATLFPTPGKNPGKVAEALTKIQKLVEKIQKVIKIIERIKKLFESLKNIKGTIGTMTRALEGLESIQGGLDQFPTKVDWDDYDIEIAQYTAPATLPSGCAGNGADFKAASNKISSRGRVYLETAREIEKLQYEVISLTLEKDTAERHAKRLEVLSTSLNQNSIPNDVIDTSNLYEIGFFIQMRLNEIRIDLAQIYVNMDAALQYYLLQGPTMFSAYTTRAIYQASVNQMIKAESSLKKIKPSEFSVPFVFNIQNVLVDDLFSLAGVPYTIKIDYPTLMSYQRVRVLEVRAYIDNLLSSTHDRVQVDVLASGEFEDRDANSNTRYFVSEPLTFPFVYEISTKTIILGNRPLPDFEKIYTQITPFTDWVIRINPDNPNNAGLQFTSTLANIRLEVYLSASVIVSTG